jgi:hypothetical protein
MCNKDNFKILFLYAEDNKDIIPSYYKIIGETKSTYKIKLIFTTRRGLKLETGDEIDYYYCQSSYFVSLKKLKTLLPFLSFTDFEEVQKRIKRQLIKKVLI